MASSGLARRTSFAAGAAVLLAPLVVGISAQADVLKSNTIIGTAGNGGHRSVALNGSTTVNYYLEATSSSGDKGCDAAVGNAAIATISFPEGVSAGVADAAPVVGPGSVTLTFTDCGDFKTNFQGITFTGTQASPPPGFDIKAAIAPVEGGTGTYNGSVADWKLDVAGAVDGGGGGSNEGCDPANAPAAPTFSPAGSATSWTNNPTYSASGPPNTTVKYYVVGSGYTATTPPTLIQGENIVWAKAFDTKGCASLPSSTTYLLDSVRPVNVLSGATQGGVYEFGNVPSISCSQTDATPSSGIATTSTLTVTPAGVDSLGSHTATCSGATDNAGNGSDSVSATYTVQYGGVGEGCIIRQPILCTGASTFSRGQGVPVKFGLLWDETRGSSQAVLGSNTSRGFDTSAWELWAVPVTCGTPDATSKAPVRPKTLNSPTFRYDASADQYVANADLRTWVIGSCWKMRVLLKPTGQVAESSGFKLVK